MKKVLNLALAVLMGSAMLAASISETQAYGRRHYHGHRGGGINGGAIAAGAIFGLAAGALIAGASSRPAYAEPSYVYDDERPVRCYIKRVRVYDEYNDVYIIERRRVCR